MAITTFNSVATVTISTEMYVKNSISSNGWNTSSSDSTVDIENTTITISSSYRLPHVNSELPNTLYSHRTAIIVIMSIFVTITLTITVAILVFCKKKNSVFVLQKSEQESESVYEMDDMNTETEVSDDDNEYNQMMKQSQTFPKMSRLCDYDKDSPLPKRNSRTSMRKYLPKSKTFSSMRRGRSRDKDVTFAPNRQRSLLSPAVKDNKRPTSLPLSSSLSTTNSLCNYQSMVITAEIEPQEKSESEDCFTGFETSIQNSSDQMCVDNIDLSYQDHEYSDDLSHDPENFVQVCTPLLQTDSKRDFQTSKTFFPFSPNSKLTAFFTEGNKNEKSSMTMCSKHTNDTDFPAKHTNDTDFPVKFESDSPTNSVQFLSKLNFHDETNCPRKSTGERTVENGHQEELVSPYDIKGQLIFEWDAAI